MSSLPTSFSPSPASRGRAEPHETRDRGRLRSCDSRTPDRLSDPPVQGSGLIRLGVATYICALLLIAAFSIAFHFITDTIVHRQETTARVVNISGRQRMLSQRIARLSLERAAHTPFRSDADTQAALIQAIALMEASHQALIHGSAAERIEAPREAAVLAVYNDVPFHLNERLEDFLAHAHALAAKPSAALTLTDPDLGAIEAAAQEPLLTALNAATAAIAATSEAAIGHLRRVLATLTLLMLVILLLEALFLYRPLFRRLAKAHAELFASGRTDPLTGCLNRRAFTQETARILAATRLTPQPLAVLMIDIDRFKAVNDRFGHPAGDQVIHSVVSTLIAGTRRGNFVCRMGGEEFAVLLRGSNLMEANMAADNLREAIAATPIVLPSEGTGFPISISVSIGIAAVEYSDETIFPALSRADKALYRAKRNGRNRVESEQTAQVPALMSAYGHS